MSAGSDLRQNASPLVEELMSSAIEHWEFSPEVERNPAKVSGARSLIEVPI